MTITWSLEKKKGNHRPLLTYEAKLDDFEKELALEPLFYTSTIPCPPESWRGHCYPEQDERAEKNFETFHTLQIPGHKEGYFKQNLRLPWSKNHDYKEVEESFAALRKEYEKRIEKAMTSASFVKQGRIETSSDTKLKVAKTASALRLLKAVGK